MSLTLPGLRSCPRIVPDVDRAPHIEGFLSAVRKEIHKSYALPLVTWTARYINRADVRVQSVDQGVVIIQGENTRIQSGGQGLTQPGE